MSDYVMTAAVFEKANSYKEVRWGPMVVLSVFFHIALFSILIFAPDSIPHRRPFEGIVYQVSLVEMPRGVVPQKSSATKPVKASKTAPSIKKATRAKRIGRPEKKTKALVIAKRTVSKKTPPVRKPKKTASQMIDRAISKIERKVKSDNGSHVDRAISKLEKNAASGTGAGMAGGRPAEGIPIQIYRMEVESWIKSNWAYPVALGDSRDLTATVVIRVKADGAILKTNFLRRSNSDIFDQSVLKAVERSDPLPPFPEIYRESYEEFEINFNLKDLENY